MHISYHYTYKRQERNTLLNEVGEGKVVYRTIQFDQKRNRNFIYEITDNAVLIVRAVDRQDLIITKFFARPSRIRQYWQDAPKEIIMLAIAHTQQKMYI